MEDNSIGKTMVTAKSTDMYVSQLSAACVRDMGAKLSLNVGLDYKDLATRLGYKLDDVYGFQARDCTNPGRVLLETWALRADTTAAVLQSHLIQMERHDVVKILQSALKEPLQLMVVVRDKSNSTIFNQLIDTYGPKTVRETLQSCAELIILISSLDCISEQCDNSVFEKKAVEFVGRQLSFYLKQDSMEDLAKKQRQLNQSSDMNTPTLPVNKLYTVSQNSSDITPSVSQLVNKLDSSTSGATWPSQNPPVIQKTVATVLPMSSEPFISEEDRKSSAASAETLCKQLPNNDWSIEEQPVKYLNHIRSPSNGSDISNVIFYLSNDENTNPKQPFDQPSPVSSSTTTSMLSSLNLVSDESDYLITSLPGYDADEYILGFHADATSSSMIKKLIKPYLQQPGSYIVRPSREQPADRCISVVHQRAVVNYRIHRVENEGGRYSFFIHERGPYFLTVTDLLEHYQRNPLSETDNESPIQLNHPIQHMSQS